MNVNDSSQTNPASLQSLKTKNLKNSNILLGVTGSIAAFKAADICSRLTQLGADVHVILTSNAQKFVGEATFRALTRNEVLIDTFDEPQAKRIAHIDLAQSADMVMVAPATADIIARMALGLADDMLTTCILATPQSTPLLVAPAMNTVMWNNPATVTNIDILRKRGFGIIDPGHGLLACQDVGYGRLAEVDTIVETVINTLKTNSDYRGRTVLVTAGATREPIDPVRFLTNRSSGKMGYAIAAEAAARGAQVFLISGFSTQPAPPNVHTVFVETANEMLDACRNYFDSADLVIAAAAVSDYMPEKAADHKLKKTMPHQDHGIFELRLIQTPDVLATLAKNKRSNQLVVGFAAETEDLIINARTKLESKNLDLIVANDVSKSGSGFDSDSNTVVFIWPDRHTDSLPNLPKRQVAKRLLDVLAPHLISN